MRKMLYLVVGQAGEYRPRYVWPVAVYESEEIARKHAEGAEGHDRDQEAIAEAWRRDVLEPWQRSRLHASKLIADANYIMEVLPSVIGGQPMAPIPEPNPFDRTENGSGHKLNWGSQYWVEHVPLLTDLPADNPGQHQQPE